MSKAKYTAAFIAAAVAGTMAMFDRTEELRLEAYPDSAGIWTICRGYTPGVKKGDKKTKQECDILDGDVTEEELLFVLDKLDPQLTLAQAKGWAHFVHNVGRTGFVTSTARRRFNAGDTAGGCEAMMMFNKISVPRGSVRDLRDGIQDGKALCTIRANDCYGMIPRREEERALCLQGGG